MTDKYKDLRAACARPAPDIRPAAVRMLANNLRNNAYEVAARTMEDLLARVEFLEAAQPAASVEPVALPDPRTPADMFVNGGALKLALNALRRSGKNEIADELEKTATPAQQSVSAAYKLPEGWRLVPCEPTLAMLDSADEAIRDFPRPVSRYETPVAPKIVYYRAMLAAAPMPPAQAQPTVKESLATEQPVSGADGLPDTESVLIDGIAYDLPAAVACELLRLNMELLQAARPQPCGNAADAEDAARYRWLRDRNDWHAEPRLDEEDGTIWKLTFYTPAPIIDPTDDDNLDAALIAAMLADASGFRPRATVKQPLMVEPSGNAGELPPLPYPYDTPAYRTVGAVIQDYARAALAQGQGEKHDNQG